MDQAWIKMDQEYRFPIRRGEIMLYVSISSLKMYIRKYEKANCM